MRIQVRLLQIRPDNYNIPKHCPDADCQGDQPKPHGSKGETKAVRDTNHQQVISYRYKCQTCERTFRVYPTGVSHVQQSDRLKAMSVLLYVLGLIEKPERSRTNRTSFALNFLIDCTFLN